MILFSFKHLSTTDSDNEPSKVPPVTSTTPTKDNQTFNSRPQSPNVEQIAEHNQTPKAPIKKKNNVEVIVQNLSIVFHLLMINLLIQHQKIIQKLKNKKNDKLNQKRKMLKQVLMEKMVIIKSFYSTYLIFHSRINSSKIFKINPTFS